MRLQAVQLCLLLSAPPRWPPLPVSGRCRDHGASSRRALLGRHTIASSAAMLAARGAGAESAGAYNLTAARLAGIQRRRSPESVSAPLRQVSRHKLTPSDAVDYAGDSLFCQFAQVCCELDGLVPRKELHEAWEAATVIHAASPSVTRVADLASGNGLLSWALMVLDTSEGRHVLCIDKVQPPSFVRIANAMTRRWPSMRHRHRYIEASIDDARLKPQPGVLLVSLHGCGTLSDKVLELALSVRAPLALVPCCHTTKTWARWDPAGVRPFAYTPTAMLHPRVVHSRRHQPACDDLEGVAILLDHMGKLESKVALRAKGKVDNWKQYGKGAAVDQARKQTLRAQGYRVNFSYISADITPRNRVLIALPSPDHPGRQQAARHTEGHGRSCLSAESSGDGEGSMQPSDGPLWKMWDETRWHGGATVWRNPLRAPAGVKHQNTSPETG